MAFVKTNNTSVIELLKHLGMPESCTRAVIKFEPGSAVIVEFEKHLVGQDIELLRTFWADKEPVKESK